MLYLEKNIHVYIINPTHFITSLKYFFSKRLRLEMQRNYYLRFMKFPGILLVIHQYNGSLSFIVMLIINRYSNFSQITPQATLKLISHQFFLLECCYSRIYQCIQVLLFLLFFSLGLLYLILLDQGYHWLRYILFCQICSIIQIFHHYYYYSIGFKFSMTMGLNLHLLPNYQAA